MNDEIGVIDSGELAGLPEPATRTERRRRRLSAGLVAVVVAASGAGGYLVGHRGETTDEHDGSVRSSFLAAPVTPADDRTTASTTPITTPRGIKVTELTGTLAFRRSTADGAEVRVRTLPHQEDYAGPGVWGDECRSAVHVGLEVSTNDVVRQLVHWIPRSRADHASILWDGDERATLLSAVVAAADGSRVSVKFFDGSTDSMVARDGMAVLVAQGPAMTTRPDLVRSSDGGHLDVAALGSDTTVTVTAPDGTVTHPPVLSSTDRVQNCSDPSLPTASGQQPTNRTAETAAIDATLAKVFSATTDFATRASLVDGGDALQPPTDGTNFDFLPAKGVRIADVSFTAADRAVVRYDASDPTNDPAGGSLANAQKLVEVHRVGGTWKVVLRDFCSITLRLDGCDNSLPTVSGGTALTPPND